MSNEQLKHGAQLECGCTFSRDFISGLWAWRYCAEHNDSRIPLTPFHTVISEAVMAS